MNRQGPQWCRENIDSIVGWMEEEVDRRLKVAEDACNTIADLERKLQEARDRPCQDGMCKIGVVKIERELAAAQKVAEPAGWQLKIAGLGMPGQKLAIKRLILLAVKRAERDLQWTRTGLT